MQCLQKFVVRTFKLSLDFGVTTMFVLADKIGVRKEAGLKKECVNTLVMLERHAMNMK